MRLIRNMSFLFSVLCSTLLFAQKPELSVKLSKNKLGINQRVRVEFSINKQGADNFQPPEFKNFKIVAGPSQSVSQSWINGKVSFSQSYTYILQPKRKGELIIGPASIQLNGDTINSKLMKLIVVDAVDIPKDPNDPNYIAQQNIHLVAEISESRPYVGEGIYVEYRLYVSENVSVFDTSVTEAPQYNGFWNQEIKINGYPVKMGKYNGEDYRYIVLQKALLIPTKTGNLVIDPMKMDIVIGVPTGRADFFGNVITKNLRKEFASPRKVIRPKALPLEGKPENFTGAVGDYNFNVTLSKDILRANESFDLKVTVSGEGNLKLFEIPEVVTPSELEKYQPARKENVQITGNSMTGSISETYTIVPQYKGKYKIPNATFSYFDPKKEKYFILSSQDLYVDVIEGKELISNNNSNSNTNSKKIENNNTNKPVISNSRNFKFIHTQTEFESAKKEDFYGSNLYYLLLLLPYLAIPAGILIANRKERRSKDVVGNRLRKAEKLVKKYLAEASKQLGKKEAFYEALQRALHNYLKAKLGIETADISKERIASLLSDKNVDEEVIKEFLAVLENADFARYTPTTDLQMKEEYNKAKKVIIQLDKQL